jgi:chromate reductase
MSASPRVRTLKTIVFLGSDRDVTPVWGAFVGNRMGDRVLAWVKATLEGRNATCGAEQIRHEVTVYDPHEVFGPGGAFEASGAGIKTPIHFLPSATEGMQKMMQTIAQADCYIVVSPEYNHSVPPALAGMLGHFPGSIFSFKPSAIVTYSIGPWGGMRAAMALRPFLSELGCLPVSKLTGIPTAQELFDETGKPIDAAHKMLAQLPDMLNQLEWMAVAMSNQRTSAGVPK